MDRPFIISPIGPLGDISERGNTPHAWGGLLNFHSSLWGSPSFQRPPPPEKHVAHPHLTAIGDVFGSTALDYFNGQIPSQIQRFKSLMSDFQADPSTIKDNTAVLLLQNIDARALAERAQGHLRAVTEMLSASSRQHTHRFCVFDVNLRNFICVKHDDTRPALLASNALSSNLWKCVDLEYAGWEDPALLCADSIAHMSWIDWNNSKSSFPWYLLFFRTYLMLRSSSSKSTSTSYHFGSPVTCVCVSIFLYFVLHRSHEHKCWIREAFADRCGDANLPARAAVYEQLLMSCWAIVKVTQLLQEVLGIGKHQLTPAKDVSSQLVELSHETCAAPNPKPNPNPNTERGSCQTHPRSRIVPLGF
jgi:hypothetical protein